MALASTLVSDFSGGIYRGRSAPPSTVYEAQNFLLNDEGFMARRGGSEYLSTSNAGTNLLKVAAGYFVGPAATRVLAWSSDALYTVDGASAPFTIRSGNGATLGRPAFVGGYAAFPLPVNNSLLFYAGGLKASYGTGTVAVTNGSPTVTGTGTSWLANVTPGAILQTSTPEYAIVASVDTDSTATLTAPWGGATGTGLSYGLQARVTISYSTLAVPGVPKLFAVAAGSGSPRLLFVVNNRAYMSPRGNPFSFDISTYQELPLGAEIRGIEPTGDSVVLFSSESVWRIDNLSLDPVDDFGNQTQVVSQISKDITLWSSDGLAAYGNSFVVPALDDVYVMAPSGSAECVSESIRPLYRSYVAAGYRPGSSTTFHGHYFLTVTDAAGTSVIDVLVCRLDRPFKSRSHTYWPWVRWSGHGAALGMASQVGGGVAPTLVGVQGQRILDLTTTFASSNANAVEADGTVPDATLITSDLVAGGAQDGLVDQVRATYELVDDGSGGTAAPTVAMAYSSDQDAGSFSSLTESGLQGGGTAGAVSAGDNYNWWNVRKERGKIRFRVIQSGAASSFVVRSIQMLYRASGKQ